MVRIINDDGSTLLLHLLTIAFINAVQQLLTHTSADCVGRNVDFGVFVIIKDKNQFSPTI